ncbi:MAG: alpha/beta hydrolase [Acidobacteria bacterium]|nr:alpha/beta hydrolase [Acidobacteriota bacterium]
MKYLIVAGVALFSCAFAVTADAADKQAVRVVKDLAYLQGANYADNKDKLDLYLPADGPERTRPATGGSASGVPVIVSFYGGALTAGDKNQQAFIGQRFAAAGFATAVVNYRLTPAVMHPGHIQDAAASFAWVKRHIAEYGGNPDQVFVIGHSAGAYLVSLLSTDERYLAAQKLSLKDIRGVVPVSAFYWVERTGVAPDRDKRVWGTDEKVWIDASPAHHLHAGLPPTLILYTDGDDEWRRQQNTEMAQAMKGAGNANVTIAMINGRTHNTIWSHIAQDGDETAERIIQFVRATIDSRATSR